jgi:hypothetical protein
MKKRLVADAGVVAGALVFALLAAGCGGGKQVVPTTRSVTTTTTSTTTSSASPAAGNIALAVPVSGSGGFNYTQGSYLEGFEFTAKSPISITKLGAYDSNLSHLPSGVERFATVPVALYDVSTHALLGSVNVGASDSPNGVYRYAALPSPITVNTTDAYAVVWVSLSNYYVASPTLVASDVNSAITYVAMVGHGPGGLTMTSTMLEPDWFYTVSANGLHAINYDLGPNFMFTTSH